jgi:FKBP-type peptidyl-prolyl cis-trans isomerase
MPKAYLLLPCILAGAVLAADEKPAAVKLETPLQKVSYVLGNNVGSRMKADGIKADVDAFMLGIREALAGTPSRLTEEETTAVLTKFQEEMQQSQEKAAEAAGGENAKKGEDFLASNAKRNGVKKTSSGLQYEVLKAGGGEQPKTGDTVKVHYHGTHIDGTVFDSSVDRGEPVEFGVTQVIPGWTEALQLRKVGSKYQLFIPAKLAYGARGSAPAISPNEALVFEVELLGVTRGAK